MGMGFADGSLREQLGKKRLRLTNDQRRRLAVRAKALGRAGLNGIACIVTPDTLMRWYRNLVAKKYDGSAARGPGRPPTENLTDPGEGFLRDKRYLIHDRDPLFTRRFVGILEAMGDGSLKLNYLSHANGTQGTRTYTFIAVTFTQ